MIPSYVKDYIQNCLIFARNFGLSVADIYEYVTANFLYINITKKQIRNYLDYETQRNHSNIFKTTGSRPVTYCFLE